MSVNVLPFDNATNAASVPRQSNGWSRGSATARDSQRERIGGAVGERGRITNDSLSLNAVNRCCGQVFAGTGSQAQIH